MDSTSPPCGPSPEELAALRMMSRKYPTVDRALSKLARLSGELALPKATVHVISDVHGDDTKLRHVINNASGMLRPLVERRFGERLSPAEIRDFLTLLFYPRESIEKISVQLADPARQREYFGRVLKLLLELAHDLARRSTRAHLVSILPADYGEVLEELLYDRWLQRDDVYWNALTDALLDGGRAKVFLRLVVRLVRNLAIDELVIAGDCWDRGARGDRVIGYLMRQPNLSFVWGNHDASWFGACLGQEAAIANVLRISLRYRRLSQIEEGYGITVQPLEHLVRVAYADDPAECFIPKGTGLRETIQMARMQKAAAVMQFKLEGQTIARNPHFQMDDQRLLHRINWSAGTVAIDGVSYPLNDRHFPTIDPGNPYELSAEERACIDRISQSFRGSRVLWDQFRFLVSRGSMYLSRDDHLIFHGCVPVDKEGEFLPFEVDGQAYRGRALFDAIDRVLARVMDKPVAPDLDLLWYLWCGPRSPLFGKDRIATFANDLVEDPATHEETKNPYFQLINEAGFCERILKEFDANPERGLIVNGHVPVKIEKGESPLKRSGKAITIDGAFSEAYGDHGYTLVLDPRETLLAKHHHFESVEAAVRDGIDIIPEISVIRQWDRPRLVGDTEQGAQVRQEINLLEKLIDAYRTNRLHQVWQAE